MVESVGFYETVKMEGLGGAYVLYSTHAVGNGDRHEDPRGTEDTFAPMVHGTNHL